MKIFKFISLTLIILFSYSCQRNFENELFEKELIIEDLVGEWEVMKFAYCDNNKKIKNETLVSDGEKSSYINDYRFKIALLENENLELNTKSLLICWLYRVYYYSIDNNSMNFFDLRSAGSPYIIYTETQNNILHALANTQRCVIKGNELRIYFTGNNEKNLLILKKYAG